MMAEREWVYDPCDLIDEPEPEWFWEEVKDLVLRPLLDGRKLVCWGSSRRWDGSSSGGFVCDGLDGLISELYRMGAEYVNVWREGGSLFFGGPHHDGGVTVEARVMTGALDEYLDMSEWEIETSHVKAWFVGLGTLSALPAA